jgi:hypothetical protein
MAAKLDWRKSFTDPAPACRIEHPLDMPVQRVKKR